MRFSKNGVPILTLEKKINALEECIREGYDEDALGHLFDLINHVCPKYKFSKEIKGINALKVEFGSDPVEVLRDEE